MAIKADQTAAPIAQDHGRNPGGEIIGARLLQLEALNPMGAITPPECDQLEALRRLTDAAQWTARQ